MAAFDGAVTSCSLFGESVLAPAGKNAGGGLDIYVEHCAARASRAREVVMISVLELIGQRRPSRRMRIARGMQSPI